MSAQLLQQAAKAFNQGQYQQCVSLCAKMLKQQPRNVTAMMLLGLAEFRQGRTEEGIAHLRKILTLDPGHLETLNNLAIILEQTAQYDEAKNCYQRAITAHPKALMSYANFGDLLRKTGQTEKAIEVLEQGLHVDEQHFPCLNYLALCYEQQGKRTQAIAILSRITKIDPNNERANANLGSLYYLDKQYEQALSPLNDALRINPTSLSALNSLAATLIDMSRLEEAWPFLERAMAIAPEAPEVLDNLGKWYLFSGELDQALIYLNQASEKMPDNLKPVWHRSFVYLLKGDYARGWDDYFAGYTSGERMIRAFPFPVWQGESLHEKTILIHAEQGIGDEIMFASCLPDVIAVAGHVIIECDSRLGELYQRAFPGAEIISGPRSENFAQLSRLTSIDYHLPCGCLPRLLRRDISNFPGTPFLRADEEKILRWRKRYQDIGENLNVGISWRAGKLNNQEKRSIHLVDMLPLLSLPGISFINLQYGDCQQEIADLRNQYGITVHHWPDSDPKNEQDDFAAQISALDAVLSVSNATVHLAGALGVKTFNLLPYVPSWRWTMYGDKTPWYDCVELLRQSSNEDWTEVLSKATDRLRALGTHG